MGNTKRGHVLFSLMICLGLVLSLGMGATGTEMTVLFEDDFSTGATKWEILQDDGDTVKPGPNNEYLLMADFENTVHMRVPDLVTNRFDLVVDLDLSTGALDWFGVHFGTTNENAFGPGHIVMIRPNGRVQLWRAPGGGSWKSGSSDEHFILGNVSRFQGREQIVIGVRPNQVVITIGSTEFVFDDFQVSPGSVDLFSIKPGPVKLYSVSVLEAEVSLEELARQVYIPGEDEIVKDVSEFEGVEPVLYLSFDHDDARDESGFGNHGVIHGNLSFINGVSDRAVYFNNRHRSEDAETDMYITFSEAELLEFGTSDFSFSFWYKSDRVASSNPSGAIVSNKNWYVTGSDPGWLVYTNIRGLGANLGFGNNIRFDAPNWGGGFPEAVDMRWHHIAVTFDRDGDMVLYIDGEVKSSVNISAQARASVDMYDLVIGADGRRRLGLVNAALDEFYAYRRVLTPEEVNNHYYAFYIQEQLDVFQRTIDVLQPDVQYSAELINETEEELANLEADLSTMTIEDKLLALAVFSEQLETTLKGKEPLFSFVVMSDPHVKATSSGERERFIAGLEDSGRYEPAVDALIICGDLTEDGTEDEYRVFYNALNRHAPTENVFAVMGNHDVRWQAGGWAEALERYLRYNGEYMGDHGGRPYFDHWINGYHFIAMNTEKDLKDDAYLSDEQLGWLEQKLGEEAEPGKPIFLVLHQPLRNTHPLSPQSGVNVGAQSDKLKGILAKYPQTVFFTGHIHNGFGYSPIVDEGYGVLVDVPSMAYNNRGYSGNAVCYYVNVYENGIKLRARDFASEIWMPEYDHSVPFNFKQAGGLGVNRE